jgi:hypothetical protein
MFVDRINGAVSALCAVRQYPGQEELPDDHADIAAFRVSRKPPIVISRLRFKLELADRGLLATVAAAVNAAGSVAQLYWAEAAEFESNHPLVAQIGAAIGLTNAQILEMFQAAAERDA